MKRIFSALAVALATLLVIGGDAVVNFGGAAASMTDAAPAVPLTIASVSALPTGTTEPSPETALFSGLLGAAALTAIPAARPPRMPCSTTRTPPRLLPHRLPRKNRPRRRPRPTRRPSPPPFRHWA